MNGPLADLPEWARELLGDARVARLGLIDDRDRPRVLPITFALEGGRLWTAIDSKPKRGDRPPARVRYLRATPQAAVTVDHYEDDWSRLAWVQLLGRASLFEVDEAQDALAALSRRYPQYRQQPPPGPLIGIEVERTLCWRA